MTTLTINNRVFRLCVKDGIPLINGKPSGAILSEMKNDPQGLRQLLATAANFVVRGVK